MADTPTPAQTVQERTTAQPVETRTEAEQTTATWSNVASQCWYEDTRHCASAAADALKQNFSDVMRQMGFGQTEAGKTLEAQGILPDTRIDDRIREPLSFAVGEGERPRLELVRGQGQPIPGSGKMALEPVTDPKILNDVSKRHDGSKIEPTYIGVDNAASYKGDDGKKHIAAGTPAWLDKPAARAFVMMNEKLAEKGKRAILASEGDSKDGAINSAGRSHTQQKIATGIRAKPGHSEHERGGALDVRNFNDPDVKAALKEFGFVQGNLSRPGVPIRNDAWHFSFDPKAMPEIHRRFNERQTRLGLPLDETPPDEPPARKRRR